MHHATARQAVDHILAGDGFGTNAIALVQATLLHDQAGCPEELRRRILTLCLGMPTDAAKPVVHPLNQQPVPVDADAVCRQLVPALIGHPADPAAASSALWALAKLWPHAGSEERPLLRTRFLNGLHALHSSDDACLTSMQLREWQKKVPTSYGSQTPSVASLRGILDTNDPLAAYLLLAEHLGLVVDLETLCWILSSLTVQLAQTHLDRDGRLASLLQGLTACERLVPMTTIEHMVTIISQISHRMWWLRAHGGMRVIRTSLDQSQRPYIPALLSGDITLAQRAARGLAGQQPARFWDDTWHVIGEHLLDSDRDLPRLLALLDVARWRAGDGVVSGDDAAALAGVIADAIYVRLSPSGASPLRP